MNLKLNLKVLERGIDDCCFRYFAVESLSSVLQFIHVHVVESFSSMHKTWPAKIYTSSHEFMFFPFLFFIVLLKIGLPAMFSKLYLHYSSGSQSESPMTEKPARSRGGRER